MELTAGARIQLRDKDAKVWTVTVYAQTYQGDRGYPIRRSVEMFLINSEWTPMIRHGGKWLTVRQNGPERYVLLSEVTDGE
jgi:hypothetical protein